MKLGRWLGLGLTVLLLCGFLYWLAGDRSSTRLSESTAQVLDRGDAASPPASMNPGSVPEKLQERSELSQPEAASGETAVILDRRDELIPEASRDSVPPAAVAGDSRRDRWTREAEERRIAREKALEAIEGAVVPPRQSGPINLQTVLVSPGGGENDTPDMPQRVESEEAPAEVLEALAPGPTVEFDMERAIQEARERGASPELKRYMESGGELGESGELPPELR